MLALLLWALVCGLCAVYLYCEWRRRAEDSDNEPPMVPGAWPILGHAPRVVGDDLHLWNVMSNDVIKECHRLGGVVSVPFGHHIIYIITDPDDYGTVANACFEKPYFFREYARPWLGDALATTPVEIWKSHRKLLNPAFNQKVLDGFMEVFNSQARRLVDRLADKVGKGPFDHTDYLVHTGVETICLTAVGMDASEHMLKNKDYVHYADLLFNSMMERLQKFWLSNETLFRWSELKKRQDRYIKVVHRISDSVLQMRKTEFKKTASVERQNGISTGMKFKPFMDLILEHHERGIFTDQEVRGHMDTIIMGGYDTTATTLLFTQILLGSHPVVQERLFQELCEVLGDTGRDVEKEDLPRLVYLEAVIKESMRLYPVIVQITRLIDTDIKLKNYTLAAGRKCSLFLYGMHRSPAVWGADADQFRPERWLDPARLPANANAFAPFSVGRRNCIGKSYALMSMKTTLAHVMRRYVVRGDHTRLRLKLDVMLKPVEGHHISIERRTR